MFNELSWLNDILRQYNCDIHCLQDTHFHDISESQIRNEWDGEILLVQKIQHQERLLSYAKNDLHYQVRNVYNDNNGNLWFLTW